MAEVLVSDATGCLPHASAGRIRRALAYVLEAELGPERAGDWEVGVTVVDAAVIHALNLEWRGVDRPTDVLSFPLYGTRVELDAAPRAGENALGDIVLCPAEAQPAEGEGSEGALVLLAVHGALHLLGYDHAEPEDEARMFALQERYAREAPKR